MIPSEAAVEAAAKAYASAHSLEWDELPPMGRFNVKETVVDILNAALPLLVREAQAEAWDQGYDRAESDRYGTGFWTQRLRANPYRDGDNG